MSGESGSDAADCLEMLQAYVSSTRVCEDLAAE